MNHMIFRLHQLHTIIKMPFYAVAKGKSPGVYQTWAECQSEITAFKGAIYKKFSTEEEAQQFVRERGSNVIDKRNVTTSTKKLEKSGGSSGADKVSSSKNGNKAGLDPVLAEMKQEMKQLQKQLSELRSKFDDYVSSKQCFSDKIVENKPSKRQERSDSDESNSSKRAKLSVVEKDKGKFSVDDEGFLIVYTDGSCLFNGRHGAQAGVGVYFGPEHSMNVSEPVKGRATNNTAEIQAAIHALKLTKSAGFDKVQINTDSQFMVNCATAWMPNWKANNWKKRDGAEVVNKEDLMILDSASEGLLVRWNHVKAHDGLEGNEAADALARAGSKMYKEAA